MRSHRTLQRNSRRRFVFRTASSTRPSTAEKSHRSFEEQKKQNQFEKQRLDRLEEHIRRLRTSCVWITAEMTKRVTQLDTQMAQLFDFKQKVMQVTLQMEHRLTQLEAQSVRIKSQIDFTRGKVQELRDSK